jgi:hypothetical protein
MLRWFALLCCLPAYASALEHIEWRSNQEGLDRLERRYKAFSHAAKACPEARLNTELIIQNQDNIKHNSSTADECCGFCTNTCVTWAFYGEHAPNAWNFNCRGSPYPPRTSRSSAGITSGSTHPATPTPAPKPTPAPNPTPAPPPPTPVPKTFYMSELFGNDMILQHDDPVVGGNCTGNGDITAVVSDNLGMIVGNATDACAAGRFLLNLAPLAPSSVLHTIEVRSPSASCGPETAVAERVLFGSVIVCGGQSNMGFTTRGEYNGTEEIAHATTANYPLIKLYGVGSANTSTQAPAVAPRYRSKWANLSEYPIPSTNPGANPVGQFSAVCWNMAKELDRQFKVGGLQVQPVQTVF